MKKKELPKKVVSSNGSARHVMYIYADSRESAGAQAMKINSLLIRFPAWHISYIL